jgi:hypothetical protein
MVFIGLARNPVQRANIHLRLVDLRPPSGGLWIGRRNVELPNIGTKILCGTFSRLYPRAYAGYGSKGLMISGIAASTTFDYLVHRAEVGYLTVDIANHCGRR